MTYSITVKAQGGQLEVSGGGDLPDGTWSISGHRSLPSQVTGGATVTDANISVTWAEPDGRKVISAQHYDQAVS